jgi:hypothetical protein
MADWYAGRMISWQSRAVIALGILAVILIAAVPVAFLTGVFMMLLGHVVGGLALFGGSVIAAVAAIAVAVMGGARRLRTLIREQLRQAPPGGRPTRPVVRLDHGEYRIN